MKDDTIINSRYLLSNRGPKSSMILGKGEDGQPLECSANTINFGGVNDDAVMDSRYVSSTQILQRQKMCAAV